MLKKNFFSETFPQSLRIENDIFISSHLKRLSCCEREGALSWSVAEAAGLLVLQESEAEDQQREGPVFCLS